MKNLNLFCLCLSFLIVISCNKDSEISDTTTCIPLEQNQSFEKIDFKENYTIQLPSGFTGNGQEEGVGARFNVETVNGADLYYEYYCSTDCWIYFGNTLDDPFPEEIDGFPLGNNEKLIKSTEFCINEEIVAVLYQSNASNQNLYAKLYMKIEGEFKEGLRLHYTPNDIDEIESILKTIFEL